MSAPQIAHYQLLELIEQDDVTETWRARDARLHRSVSVQILRRTPDTPPEVVEAFRREARVASLVTHPHIAAVHNWGEEDGQPFVVSEMLSGQRLDAMLERGPLPLDRAIDLAIQLGGAMVAIHRRGLVHGRINPSNIVVTSDGHLKLLGLGRAIADPTASPEVSAFATTAVDIATTEVAPPVADPYLPPEQVAGHAPAVQSDIYAAGALLYAMVTGAAPFEGADPVELAKAIVAGPPVPVRQRNRVVPPSLAACIERAMAKDPAQRQPAPQVLLDELRAERGETGSRLSAPWVRRLALALVAVLVVGAVAFTAWRAGWFSGPQAPPRPRNSVLLTDIVNGTGDPDFEGTLRQAVSVYLGQSPYLDVVSDERVREGLQMMGRTPGTVLTHAVAAELCQRLGVQAMLEGSISAVGGNLMVALVASDCEGGGTIAREQAEVPRKEDVLQLVGELTARVRTALGEPRNTLASHNVRIEDATTSSLEALRAYTEATAQRATGQELLAIQLLQRAVSVDPDFALAHTTLSSAYGSLGETGLSEEYARRAYEKRDRVSERERLFIAYQYHDRVTGNQISARQALEVWSRTYPRDYRPSNALAVLLNRFGDFDDGAAQAEEAMRRNPAHAFPYSNLAHARRAQGRYAEARAVAERAVAQRLETVPMRRLLYQVGLLLDDEALASAQVAWAATRSRGFDVTGARAQAAAFHGRITDARQLYAETIAAAEAQRLPQVASGYAAWAALTEVLYGDRAKGIADARVVARTSTAPEPALRAALALALAGQPSDAEAVLQKFESVRPEDTFLNASYRPVARAAIALARRRPAQALEALRPAATYQFGLISALAPTYLEAQAYAQAGAPSEAARVFAQIGLHRGTDPFSPLIPMAQLGLARAHAAAGDLEASRLAYDTLLEWWKDADDASGIVRDAARRERAAISR